MGPAALTLQVVIDFASVHNEPSSQQLLTRLEKDIQWLQRRGLWTRSLFEKAVLRYVEAKGSTDGLERFSERHKIGNSTQSSWIPR